MAERMKSDALAFVRDAKFVERRVQDGLHDLVPAERAAAAVHEHKLVRTKLSSLAEGVLSRIINFRQSASDADRIILVFAAEDALSDEHRRTLEDVKAMGREACWSGLRC